jgi:four helix bundle protein
MERDRFEFEGLAVFRAALELVEETDRLAVYFRGHRRRLGFQMFDAASSIVLNLTESRRRSTRADKARFLDMANGSASETAGALCIADRLGVGPEARRHRIRVLTREVISMLTPMIRHLRATTSPTAPPHRRNPVP